MIHIQQLNRFIKSFFRRIKRGEFLTAIYLSYFYSYLYVYDLINRTNFTNSQTPEEGGVPSGGTGNFPAHPRIVRLLIAKSGLDINSNILDVGSGSGIVLFVADKLGYKYLTGVEFSRNAFEISRCNLKPEIELINKNALDVEMSIYDAIFFFSPFRGNLAVDFFKKLPPNIKKIIAVNYDRKIDPLLQNLGFTPSYCYQHIVYKNFNAKIFQR